MAKNLSFLFFNGLCALFVLLFAGCSGTDTPAGGVGGTAIPLYNDGGVQALKNWPPPADPKMLDSNTPRDVAIKGADNVLIPDGSKIANDTWSPNCPDLQAPVEWPHPGNKRDITVKNSCSFPIWIGLQSDTLLPPFCSASKAACSDDAGCPAVAQTCSGGVCSEDTKTCSTNSDCTSVSQVCVKNAKGDGFRVSSGDSKIYKLPNIWISGALWGRTNCRDCTADQSVGKRCCDTGDAGGTLYNRHHDDGSAIGMEKPTTKVELNFKASPDYYDVSQVDGFNLPAQMTPVKGTGDDKTKTTGYWLGCPGVTGDVNKVCPDAAMIQDTGKYPFSKDFSLGIALKNTAGKTIACFNGCSYKTRGSCKSDGLRCRKDEDCATLKVCSRDDKACTKDKDCSQTPDAQACVEKTQSCFLAAGNPNLWPGAADYCCDASDYCHTLSTDKDCGSKKKCPATAISAFYKALAPSAYAYTMGEDDWSTFNAGWKNGVGPDYYIEFCPAPLLKLL